MGYIQCCGGMRKCRTFELKKDDSYILKELNYLEECPVCGHTVVQLTRLSRTFQVNTYRIKNKKARIFFEKYKKDILSEKKDFEPSFTGSKSKFYLNYNEYGKKKKCYSNLSSMKLGLFENNF